MGEVLLLQREPTNIKDSLDVSVMKSTLVVGHVPASFSGGGGVRTFSPEHAIKVQLKLLMLDSIVDTLQVPPLWLNSIFRTPGDNRPG